MILPFSTQLNGKPTYFIDKIWIGLCLKHIINARELEEYFTDYRYKFGKSFDQIERPLSDNYFGKLHTIREDKTDRWKRGVMIDFYINNRSKNAFCFAPRIPVISTQDIFMTKRGNDIEITISKVGSYMGGDDFYLYHDDKEKLAINDGFVSYSEFVEYFSSVIAENGSKTGNYWFSGKIIHWTNLKY